MKYKSCKVCGFILKKGKPEKHYDGELICPWCGKKGGIEEIKSIPIPKKQPTDVPMFDHLGYDNWSADKGWDGHSTEEKYRRLRKIISTPKK